MLDRMDHKVIVIGARDESRSLTIRVHFKLIKDAIILIEITEMGLQIIMYRDRSHRFTFHIHIPDFDRQIVT